MEARTMTTGEYTRNMHHPVKPILYIREEQRLNLPSLPSKLIAGTNGEKSPHIHTLVWNTLRIDQRSLS